MVIEYKKRDSLWKDISRLLSYKFTDDEDYIEAEIEHDLKRTLCFALKIEHLTGKIVNES